MTVEIPRDTAREEKALAQVRERLVDAYGRAHSVERVESAVGEARKRFEGRKIREFVPILVERIVRRELEPEHRVDAAEQVAADIGAGLKDGDAAAVIGDAAANDGGAAGNGSEPANRRDEAADDGGVAANDRGVPTAGAPRHARTEASVDGAAGAVKALRRGAQRLGAVNVRDKRVLAAAAVAVVAVAAVAVAVGGSSSESGPVAATPATLTTVRGVIGSEKAAFFGDPRVIETLAGHGLTVEVDPAGSRQIATSVDLADYDFAFPSSSVAAERIQRQAGVSAKYTPFSSPMIVATFRPIVDLLTAAGVVRPGPTPVLDMAKYLELVERGTQWDQLPGNTAYPVRKHMLISTTDPRTSNSAAMYLAVASHVANEHSVVRGAAAEEHALSRVARLFTRQGYTENSSEGPFREYLSTGMGTTPLVWAYEAQYVEAAVHGELKPDMVMLYPSPTVMSHHTVVPLSDSGDRLGQLLSTDPELQRLAAEYGFRTGDAELFTDVAQRNRVPVTANLIDVADLPSYETLERLLDGVAKSYN
ncbi:three-helix bundle dimerization domain-containing protein [Nocardia otitidiscaviarum]|uniref:three-helix bundle dimerization domain-containing protein n=1 Tax=Nocardia otitidiscaviarum TaxID=1823 RepID=UPI002B4B49E8|nr:hypothetical protein [Nocardia otitidiscaviarum]